jgi:hypothetical protein
VEAEIKQQHAHSERGAQQLYAGHEKLQQYEREYDRRRGVSAASMDFGTLLRSNIRATVPTAMQLSVRYTGTVSADPRI